MKFSVKAAVVTAAVVMVVLLAALFSARLEHGWSGSADESAGPWVFRDTSQARDDAGVRSAAIETMVVGTTESDGRPIAMAAPREFRGAFMRVAVR